MSKDKDLILDNFLISGSQLSDIEGEIVSTFLSMDIALGGGIPMGSSVLIAGKQKSGKTTFALHFAAQAQKLNKDLKIFFFDVEGRLRSDLLGCIKDLDLNRFFIVKSNKDKILSGEDFLNLLISTLKDYPGCVTILDSIAALAPEAELSSLIGDSARRANIPTMMYQVFRQTSQTLAVTQSIFIGLTHLIANPSGYGKTTSVVGGNAQQYQCNVWLEVPYVEGIFTTDKSKRLGQMAKFQIMASALGGPGAKVDVPIIYGKGIDTILDLFNISVELGLIVKGGAWYSFNNDLIQISDDKMQGRDNVLEFLLTNNKIAQLLEKYIRNITGIL